VAASGDVIGDREVGSFIDAQGGRAVFAEVAPFLRQADLAFVNLESPLSTRGEQDQDKEVTFRGRRALIAGLSAAGIDAVSVANNHALDYGPTALKDTLAGLDRAGIAHAGAGADLTAARAPGVVKTPGGSVAVLAYTLIEPAGFLAGKDSAGVNPGRENEPRLLRDITRAKTTADWVVVSFHWGTEYQGRADEDQRRLAHRAIDAGADLVLGHHPHVLQGFELYRNRLIAYSLGDLVFDHYSRATGETVILRATLSPTGPPSFTLVPVYLSDSHGIPAPVTGSEARSILERMRLYSGELGLQIKVDGDRATYPAASN
jgi:poly-gamma-glutamate capsule biosynthesis protein CapA/YwtB (metallophosphatase superfamily)